MKKAFYRRILLALETALCVCLFNGCVAQSQDSGEQEENHGGQRTSVLEGRERYDLLNRPWQDARETVPAEMLWNHNAYCENLIQDPADLSIGTKHRAVEGKDYYILAQYTLYVPETAEGREETLYCLNRTDGDTLETDTYRVHLEELGEGPFYVNSLDVSEGRPVLFLYRYDQEREFLTDYQAVWFDGEGHVESSLNLMPALREAGFTEQTGYLPSDMGKWDSQGYFCIKGVGETYAVIDAEGKLVTVLDPVQDMEGAVVNLYHDGEGRCIWETACAAGQCTVFWGIREGQQASLYRGNYQIAKIRLFNAFGDMYYIDGRDNLVRWDLSTGKCEKLYEGSGGTFGDCYAAAQDSEGGILLFYDVNGRDYLFRIANKDVEQEELTLAVYGSWEIRMLAEEYNRLHPNVRIVVQSGSREGQESEWARLLADLSAGKGPDLLVTDREHMEVLQEKGILADLSRILTQETQEALFPGALEYGTIDGGLYTVCYGASAESVLVSRQVWPKDSWTWEDVVSLLDEREAAGQPYMSVTNVSESGMYLLTDFFLADLEHSSLLDWEKKEAYFDTEAFYRLLEVCKRYTGGEGNSNSDQEEARKRLRNGEILCYLPGWGGNDFMWFSEDMAALGEEYHFVGFPTEDTCRGLFHAYSGIAVNAASPHPELAADVVNAFVSQSFQEMLRNPVRRDTYTRRIREHIEYRRADGKSVVFLRDGKYSTEIDGKPDGTSYLPEYLEYMNDCKALSGVTEPIIEIIGEEAQPFFDGDKDARTVAGIIQNRVQLYLDENW